MPLLDPPLVPPPKIRLSRLRDIGWSIWDPIGILGSDQNWNDKDCLQFANEYDNYLISAASQLRRNAPAEQVVRHLMDIEIECMGLGKRDTTRKRAEAVVIAILEDESIWTWPNNEGKFE